MKNQVTVALASFGMSGKVFHGPLLKVNENFKVKFVLERSKNLSKELFPDAIIVKTYDALLADNEVELVVVNTPDKFHYTMVKQALKAGKHVVVEKPATLQSAELEELIGLAKANGLVFTVFQNRRWDGDFRTVQKVIDEARFGPVGWSLNRITIVTVPRLRRTPGKKKAMNIVAFCITWDRTWLIRFVCYLVGHR